MRPVATPEPSSAAEPMLAPLSLTVTRPVGEAVAEVTVAVKVTGCPETLGFELEVRVVAVEARPTTRVTRFDAAGA